MTNFVQNIPFAREKTSTLIFSICLVCRIFFRQLDKLLDNLLIMAAIYFEYLSQISMHWNIIYCPCKLFISYTIKQISRAVWFGCGTYLMACLNEAPLPLYLQQYTVPYHSHLSTSRGNIVYHGLALEVFNGRYSHNCRTLQKRHLHN